MNKVYNFVGMNESIKMLKQSIDKIENYNKDIHEKLVIYSKTINDETQRKAKQMISNIVDSTNSINDIITIKLKKIEQGIVIGISTEEEALNMK